MIGHPAGWKGGQASRCMCGLRHSSDRPLGYHYRFWLSESSRTLLFFLSKSIEDLSIPCCAFCSLASVFFLLLPNRFIQIRELESRRIRFNFAFFPHWHIHIAYECPEYGMVRYGRGCKLSSACYNAVIPKYTVLFILTLIHRTTDAYVTSDLMILTYIHSRNKGSPS